MFRSGFICLIGRPNVGKSTLINQLVGEKIAITSPVVQTTRHRIKGIVTTDKGQIVLMDTPGFSKPLDQLGEYLTKEAQAAVQDADAIVMVVDLSQPPGKGDQWIIDHAQSLKKPIILVLNKRDKLKNNPEKRHEHKFEYLKCFETPPKVLLLSAKTGKNVSSLTDQIFRLLPEGPVYYPEDALTDQRVREISAEIIREKVLHNTKDELPHSVAIGIETFEEKPEITKITATAYVNQPSQKKILIGRNGEMIKTIGTQARKDIEKLLDTKVFLNLQVKTKKQWRKNDKFLKSLGLAPPSN